MDNRLAGLVDERLPAVWHALKPSTHASDEDYIRGYVVYR
jgi:hypothetical protein